MTITDKMLRRARKAFPNVENYRIASYADGTTYVEGCFDNSLGEFISTTFDGETFPSSLWFPTGIESTDFTTN